ncbi:MAG: ATP-binding protein [Candidatus Omnitrophica bacterium]|nr:ATP-binding protein [Candidatus Omnitrophota bacterium]MCA9444226.1 ATP-binding protein [Candidatus Omnitrophota bacterium]
MTQLKNPTAGGTLSGVDLQLEDLTREQKTVLGRIAHRFREAAVGQVLTGPPETGKSTLAEMVGKCLEEQSETVLISKGKDPAGGQKRLMFEAYGAYPYFLSAVLKQLGFFVRGEEPDLVEQLVEQLRKLRTEDKRLLLIIDDAQDISPTVWKRLQPWLDYQDRGVRMIQVLLVGSPELKKKLGDPAMRGWRRWIHGTYDLSLVKGWKLAGEEARRMLKRACEVINEKTQPTDPIRPPQISWFAVQKIVKESGGRPGRMKELLKRVLSANIREGGSRISYRFLHRADALRSPAMQWYKLRQNKSATATQKAADLKKKFQFSLRGKKMHERTKNPRIPEHPLGWMRYALGTLLIVFILGAGWGVSAWLSVAPDSADTLVLAEEEPAAVETESPVEPVDVAATEAVEPERDFEVATTEPVEDYPLDVFDQSWEQIDPVAVSQAISASLEQEFQELDSSGVKIGDAFPPREESLPPREPAPVVESESETVAAAPPAEPAVEETAPIEEAVAEAESALDSLEDFTLPEREEPKEEMAKAEPEPLDAKSLGVPEGLIHQTVNTGVVSIPAPKAGQKPTAAPKQAPRSTRTQPAASSPQPQSNSRDRLLEAMTRLEKSLK